MTVSTTITPRIQYSGSGTTGPFATSFVFSAEGDLKVIKTDTSGVDSTLTLTTNYTVSGGGSPAATGSVTLLVALAVGETLTILRETDRTQETDYIENDSFPAETHEGALDKLTLLVQEVEEIIDRSLVLSETSTLSGIVFPSPGAGEIIKWNAGGTALETGSIGDVGAFTAGTGLTLSAGVLDWAASIADLSDVTITGVAKGDIIGYDGTAWVDLTVGSNGEILSANSSEATGLEWISNTTTLDGLSDTTITVASKGDIMAYNGSAWVDLTPGSNGQYLSANSAEVTGLEWVTAAGGLANVVEDTTPQLGGDLDLNGNQITSPDGTDLLDIPNGSIDLQTASTSRLDISDSGVRLGAANARVTTILDEDAMGSDSDTALATQQSIKAYVDASSGGGGSWSYVSTTTASGATSVDFSGLTGTTYKVVGRDIVMASDNRNLEMLFSSDGGSTYFTTNVTSSMTYSALGTTVTSITSDGDFGYLARSVGANTNEYGTFMIAEITNLNDATLPASVIARSTWQDLEGDITTGTSAIVTSSDGGVGANLDVDSIRIDSSSGNISGTFYLYELITS